MEVGHQTDGGGTCRLDRIDAPSNDCPDSRLPVVLIGASGSIGRSILTGLVADGFNVYGTARSRSMVNQLEEEFREHSVSIHELDVQDYDAVRGLIDRVALETGGIYGLVYAVGLQSRRPIEEFPDNEIVEILSVNLMGAVVASKSALKHMVQQRKGRIVFAGSLTSRFSINGIAPYAMAKSGLSSWARSIAVEFAKFGVTANTVLPGRIESQMIADVLSDSRRKSTLSRIPSGRLGVPEDVSNAVSFLVKEESSYINGSEIVVDGAWLAGGGNISG